jgi:RES domain-containing protein
MRAVRLAKRRYADLSGEGAAISGARWNSKGKPMAYTSSCGALAVVEYLAHVSMLPSGLMLMLIEIPDTLKIERVHSIPADPAAFTQIGDEWLDSKATAVLEVPSVLIPRQKNYLINPEHPLFGAISIIESNPFAFDSRLLSSITIPGATPPVV